MNPADAVARYRSSVPLALDRVRAMSGDQLASTLNLFDMMTTSGVNFLAMALKHSVHHRGQLSTYLRAMGGTVPGNYGPLPTHSRSDQMTGVHVMLTSYTAAPDIEVLTSNFLIPGYGFAMERPARSRGAHYVTRLRVS
jgi:hypothetical protein